MNVVEMRTFILGNLLFSDGMSPQDSRRKLRHLAEFLDFNPVDVSKLLSVVSDLVRSLGEKEPGIVFEVKLNQYGAVYSLVLDFYTQADSFRYDENLLKTVFDDLDVAYKDSRVQVQLSINVPKSDIKDIDAFVDEASELISQLTEEEYLRELKRARDAATSANKAKSEFLAVMSHEIRTPMNGVVGMAEVLATSKLDTYQADSVKVIQDSALSLLTIIDDILDFSKMDAGRLDLERTEVSLRDLLEGACLALNPLAIEKAVNLSLYVDPQVPVEVWSDPTRLRQVLYNLIGNAIKFSNGSQQHAGQVAIRLEPVGANPLRLAFSIADNGIGIARTRCVSCSHPFNRLRVLRQDGLEVQALAWLLPKD